MTDIKERVLINIGLETIFPTQRTFRGIALFDDDLIPTDIRVLTVTANGFSDVVGTSGPLYEACLRYFQLNARVGPPADLFLGRLIETDSSPFWAAGEFVQNFLTYRAIDDGAYAVTDGSSTVQVPGNDFSGVSSFSDVIDVMNAVLSGLSSPAVTGLDTAEWELDAIGRLRLVNSTTGSTAEDISVIAPSSGTDLAALFDSDNGASHPGLDAMSLLESYESLKLIEKDFWLVMARGGDDTEMVELAQKVNSEERWFAAFEDSSTAVNPASSADLASQIDALSIGRASATYSAQDSYAEFAQFGASMGAKEGSCAFGFEAVENVLLSGDAIYQGHLTSTQMAALDDKNYNWIEMVSGIKSAYPGRSTQGREIRMMLGRDWMIDQMQVRLYAARIKLGILGFDTASLVEYERNIREVLEEAKSDSRRIITRYTMNMPDADSFSAAQKNTHVVTLEDVFQAEQVVDGWKYEINGSIALVLPANAA